MKLYGVGINELKIFATPTRRGPWGGYMLATVHFSYTVVTIFPIESFKKQAWK